MNVDHLREFVYLAETLNFAVTARHFFISSSVLSKHVSAMEDDLQVKLFDRDSRKVVLTEEGGLFYRDVVSVIAAFDRAVSNVETRRKRK